MSTEDAAAAAAEAAAAAKKAATDAAKKVKAGLGAGGAVLGIVGGLVLGGVLCAGALLAWKHRHTIFGVLSPSSEDQPPTQQPANVTQFRKQQA